MHGLALLVLKPRQQVIPDKETTVNKAHLSRSSLNQKKMLPGEFESKMQPLPRPEARGLSSWFLVGWHCLGRLQRGVALMKEGCHWGPGSESLKAWPTSLALFLSVSCVQLNM